MRYMVAGLLSALIFGALLAGSNVLAAEPLKTVEHVDLERYMGHWHEIAALPMYFQNKCTSNTTADYTLLDNGTVQVVNGCDTTNGHRNFVDGRAKVVDPKTNAKLKVTFLNFLGWRYIAAGDYWITALAPDYSYAIVGHPNRKYGWILARSPMLPKETLQELSKTLTSQGYDPCQFIAKPQKDGFTRQQTLCEATR